MKEYINKLIEQKIKEYKWGESESYEYGQEPGWWKGQLAAEDTIPGGKGDKLNINDVDKEELKKGIRVEMEHTTDPKIAVEIALDHLAEDPKYYTNLEKVHKESVNEATEFKDVKDVKDGNTIVIKKGNKPVHLKVNFVSPWRAGGKEFNVTDVKTGKKGKLKIKFLTTRPGTGLADPTQVEVLKESVIMEGVNDPGILKAVFLAGGPGSGKSFTAEKVFGIDNIMKGTSTLGLKVVNSDPAFERELKLRGVDPKNLAKMTDKVFKYYTSKKDTSARSKAKVIKDKLEKIYQAGRLGLIIDGTGHDYEKIAAHKKKLEDLGYDTSMLFVNTSLDVAKQRNAQRDRVLPDDVLVSSWQEVQNNMGKFQTLFKNNFQIIDNTEIGDFNKMHSDKIKTLNKIIQQPLKNRLGKQWIETEKKLRNIK